jgi:AcrR family transcriptional regulator
MIDSSVINEVTGEMMIEKQEEKLRQLVSAAVDLFYEKGFERTRISDIVGKAGVAQGTFYLYFKSKDEVFFHICREFTRLFSAMINQEQDLFAGDSYEKVHENLYQFIRELIQLFAAHSKMAKIIFFEGGGYGGKFREVYEGIYIQFVDMISNRLEKSRRNGYIDFEDAKSEAAFLIGLFDRSLFYFMEIKKQVDVGTLSRQMTDFIMGGLSKKQTLLPE